MNAITEFRIYLRLRPTLAKLKGLCAMKLSTNIVIQIFALVIQGANQISSLLPAKSQTAVALGVGILQSISALIAHFSNTNGTPQELPGGAAAGGK